MKSSHLDCALLVFLKVTLTSQLLYRPKLAGRKSPF
jgi:hypothetical protein